VGGLQFYGDCLTTSTSIDIDSRYDYSYASQTHGGAMGDRGSADYSGVSFVAYSGATPLAQPVTGFVTSGSNQIMFSLYQLRDTNIFNQPFCTFGGYLVVN